MSDRNLNASECSEIIYIAVSVPVGPDYFSDFLGLRLVFPDFFILILIFPDFFILIFPLVFAFVLAFFDLDLFPLDQNRLFRRILFS